jgi:hypothetical protein
MSKVFLMSCGTIALASATGLYAQTSPATPPPGQGDKAVAGVVASVTLTGCLERWSSQATASPTGAPTEKAPAGAEFVLTQVDGQTASATAAGGGTPTATEQDKQYLLLSSPSIDLPAHLNHKVKIVGTIAPQPSEGASAVDRMIEPSSSETNLPQDRRSEAYRANLIEVSSLTMVARSCGN